MATPRPKATAFATVHCVFGVDVVTNVGVWANVVWEVST